MPGDFSQEAYEQLRAAYANEALTQLDAEIEGTTVMGQKLTLETLPVDSPWRDKVEAWEYPTGKSAYLDGKQDPAEILQLMRDAAQERIDAKQEIDTSIEDVAEMSDEELDNLVNELLSDDEEEEVEEEGEGEDAPVDSADEVEEEVEEEEEPTEEPEEEYDPDVIAAEISALREELESMRFVSDDE